MTTFTLRAPLDMYMSYLGLIGCLPVTVRHLSLQLVERNYAAISYNTAVLHDHHPCMRQRLSRVTALETLELCLDLIGPMEDRPSTLEESAPSTDQCDYSGCKTQLAITYQNREEHTTE